MTAPVAGDRDFRTPRPVGAVALDDAYAGVVAGGDGLARVSVTHPSAGTATEIAFDPEVMPWVQVHTAGPPRPRRCTASGWPSSR